MDAIGIPAKAHAIEQRWEGQLKGDDHPTIGVVGATDKWIQDDFCYLDEVAEGIIEAGGRPVLLSPSLGESDSQMAGVDGIVVVGGADVDPAT